MKKIILSLCTLAAALWVSCDKIDDDKYIIYSGVVGEWYDDANTVVDASQRAIVEKFTGVRCINCPTADEVIHDALTKYGDQLIAVAIHPMDNPFTIPFSGDPDLRSEIGKTWCNEYGFTAFPWALLNRSDNTGFLPTSNFDVLIDAQLNATPRIAVQVEASKETDSTLGIDVHIAFLETVDNNLMLTLILTEDGIHTSQKMPDGTTVTDFEQNHVLRTAITDAWGTAIDKGASAGAAGTTRRAHFSYTIESDTWNIANCHIVAFVSNRDSKEILNGAECGIENGE